MNIRFEGVDYNVTKINGEVMITSHYKMERINAAGKTSFIAKPLKNGSKKYKEVFNKWKEKINETPSR